VLYRVMFVAVLGLAALAACGRYGFEDRASNATADAPRVDAAKATGDAVVVDGVGGAAVDGESTIDGVALACAYMSCPDGKVTCCAGGSPQCISENDPCDGERYECTQGPPEPLGCNVAGEQCCIVCDGSTDTECVNPIFEPCCG
jgi:hypothetical protein